MNTMFNNNKPSQKNNTQAAEWAQKKLDELKRSLGELRPEQKKLFDELSQVIASLSAVETNAETLISSRVR